MPRTRNGANRKRTRSDERQPASENGRNDLNGRDKRTTGRGKKKRPESGRGKRSPESGTRPAPRRNNRSTTTRSHSADTSEPPPKRPRRQATQRSLTESDIPRIVEAVLKAKDDRRTRDVEDDYGGDSSDSDEEVSEEVTGRLRNVTVRVSYKIWVCV